MRRNSRKQRLVAEINITPFTDVILVLLVIFMITAPLLSQVNIKVNLPVAKSEDMLEHARSSQIEIVITREGPIYLDGNLVTKKELKGQVGILRRNNPDLSVVLRCDKTVKFQDLVNVLDPLTDLGITKLNIAATNER